MLSLLDEAVFSLLKQTLPMECRVHLENEKSILAQAYPLLRLICTSPQQTELLAAHLGIRDLLPKTNCHKAVIESIDEFKGQFNSEARFPCRLPVILGEFPIHSRAVNQATGAFNTIIEAYYQEKAKPLALDDLESKYDNILSIIAVHGAFCDGESLWQLMLMLAAWSKQSPLALYSRLEQVENPLSASEPELISKNKEPLVIHEQAQKKRPQEGKTFLPDYNYNVNGAGRLAEENAYLLLNAFGMKIGGHFDAQVKSLPRFIPIESFHAMIRRQLAHRLTVWECNAFTCWLEICLHELGVDLMRINQAVDTVYINPFFKDPLNFINPEKINHVLNHHLTEFKTENFAPTKAELDIISQYLFELLQGFQCNPGQALGIGANWDNTVDLSNEAGAYAFKFPASEMSWATRFKELSLHRQGPSEARMNATIGVGYELQALLTSFNHMNQLQTSEYRDTIYNALIDNLVSCLLPYPPYFENSQYQKYRKQYVVKRTNTEQLIIDGFLVPCEQGTYFKDRAGNEKQTPMYRRAGTMDIQAFPRNTGCSEQSRVSYEGNPLGPLQMQFAQAMCRNLRGHIVYDPIGRDQFIEDPFYGQVILGANGDILPFIGVIPKNFDKHFHQQQELCASFVVRMLHSSRLYEYCPTFRCCLEAVKTRFLADSNTLPPRPPEVCSAYIEEKYEILSQRISEKNRSFTRSEHAFYSLFKNLIYSLYAFGREDAAFQHSYLPLIHSRSYFYPSSKARCEKIIRDFCVHRPASISAENLSAYEAILAYLSTITDYFYPKPSEALAKEIARQATLHVNPLLKTQALRDYFKDLKHHRAENFSRKQSPAMLYAALKHDGPSKTVAKDYGAMHKRNFPSFYRDQDGTMQGKPQGYENLLDKSAKNIGAALQLLHKYHPLAFINRPLFKAVSKAREQAFAHQQNRAQALWVASGFAKGLIWDGFTLGLWQSLTSPLHMLADLLSWKTSKFVRKKEEITDNPLAISAAPANEANVKAAACALTRDFLLQLMLENDSLAEKKQKLHVFSLTFYSQLYPYLSEEDLQVCRQDLEARFPLNAEAWQRLFDPLISPHLHEALSAVLQSYKAWINQQLVQATLRCITAPLLQNQAAKVLKESQSFFSLNARQSEALANIVNLFIQCPVEKKMDFIHLFEHRGLLNQALQKRDRAIQTLQIYILEVFKEEQVKNLIFQTSIQKIMQALNESTLETTFNKLPVALKWPLYEVLEAGHCQKLNHYRLSEEERMLLEQLFALYQQIENPLRQEAILRICQDQGLEKQTHCSVKTRAHQQWASFTEREYRHELLSFEEANKLFKLIASKMGSSLDARFLISDIKAQYHHLLEKEEPLDLFYKALSRLHDKYSEYLNLKKNKTPASQQEALRLLLDFRNISMNAIVNSLLDKVNIFSGKAVKNPLLQFKAIHSWLFELNKNKADLQDLLNQQRTQAPSLDHAIWRIKCLFQVIEQSNSQQKIKHTGIQSLLRFWSQHHNNVKLTGDTYYQRKEEKYHLCHPSTLFEGSATMEHALRRVCEKLPPRQRAHRLYDFWQEPSPEKIYDDRVIEIPEPE